MKHPPTRMTFRRALLLGFALVLLDSRLATAASAVVIDVQETAGIRRFQYPVAVKLHLTEPVARETRFRLLLDNQPVLAQFRPAEEHEAVAAWWLDFPVDLAPYQTLVYRVEYGAELPDGRAPQRGHQLLESDGLFQIVNEPAIAWSVDRKLLGLVKSIRSGELEYLRPDSLGLWLTDRSGNEHRIGREVTGHVIRNGPLAVGLRFESLETQSELAGVRSVVDLVFPVFKSWIEVEWRVADPADKVASFGAQLDAGLDEPTRTAPTLVDFGATSLVYVSLPPGQAALLRSDPSVAGSPPTDGSPRGAWEILRGPADRLEPFVFGPRFADGDLRPEGWVHVMDRRRCLALAVDDFARETKDRISASAAGAVRLDREFSTDAAVGRTKAKRFRFWVHCIPFPPQQTAATSPQSMQNPPQTRIRVGQDP